MPEIISLKEARRLGLKSYYTGRPCPHGHVVLRSVTGRACRKCAVARAKKGKEKNPQKANDYRRLYRAKNKEKLLASRRLYYQNNCEKLRAAALARRARNIERSKETGRVWRLKNPGYQRKYQRKYWHEGPQNPKGGLQWIRKGQAELRKLKRLLQTGQPLPRHLSAELSRSLSEAFTAMPT